MAFFTYILYSETLDRYYTGSCQDLDERLQRHNTGRNRSTKSGVPWVIVFWEVFPSRSEAIAREQYIKRMKSRLYIQRLIEGFDPPVNPHR